MSGDGTRIVQPDPEGRGAAYAMRQMLKDASAEAHNLERHLETCCIRLRSVRNEIVFAKPSTESRVCPSDTFTQGE